MVKCNNCGHIMEDDTNFCSECGNILNGEKTIKNKSKINNNPIIWFKKQNTIVKIVGFCFVLIMILGIAIFLFIFIQTFLKVHNII